VNSCQSRALLCINKGTKKNRFDNQGDTIFGIGEMPKQTLGGEEKYSKKI